MTRKNSFASVAHESTRSIPMIKVMWFLKRKEGLSLSDFREWWLNRHAHDVAHHQAPHLARYIVNIRVEEDDLPGRPAEEPEWDGVAEQWFETEDAFRAVYGRAESPTRADTLAHVSRFQRLVVVETDYSRPHG
jgi:hypothetical protein